MIFIFMGESAHASFRKPRDVGYGRRGSIGLTLGARYVTQYKAYDDYNVPIPNAFGEIQLSFWPWKHGSVYFNYAKGLKGAYEYGLGGKWMFVKIEDRTSIVSGLGMAFAADITYHKQAKAQAPYYYKSSDLLKRIGGTTYIFIARSMFVDMTMMVHQFNGAWFVAPFIGVGFSL